MADHWIKFNTNVWRDKVITSDTVHLAVWCYLKCYAVFTEVNAVFAGKAVKLTPGQLITGCRHIAEALSVDKNKVRRILDRFEDAGLIRQTVTKHGRLITVIENENAPRQQKTAASPRKTPKESVYNGDASYDLEAYRRTAIGLYD